MNGVCYYHMYEPLLILQSSDYNYALNGDKCVAVGPEPVPINVCDHIDQTYQGSSGYRRIPGNTCVGGEKLDNPVTKQCSQGMA